MTVVTQGWTDGLPFVHDGIMEDHHFPSEVEYDSGQADDER